MAACPYFIGFDLPEGSHQCRRLCRGFNCRWRDEQERERQAKIITNNTKRQERADHKTRSTHMLEKEMVDEYYRLQESVIDANTELTKHITKMAGEIAMAYPVGSLQTDGDGNTFEVKFVQYHRSAHHSSQKDEKGNYVSHHKPGWYVSGLRMRKDGTLGRLGSGIWLEITGARRINEKDTEAP